MEYNFTCCFLQRVVLPIILGLCILVRPVAISLMYLLMFFILPFIPIVTTSELKASLKAYFIILITLTTLIVVGHCVLIIYPLISGKQEFIEGCTNVELLMRHIGFLIDQLNTADTFKWIWSDILLLSCSILIFIGLKKLSNPPLGSVESMISAEASVLEVKDEEDNQIRILRKLGPVSCLASLFLAAVFRPSAPGGLYFLVFLLSATHWACYKSFARGFSILLRCVMIVLAFHIITILSYQTPWSQEYLPNNTLPARLVALESLVLSVCDSSTQQTHTPYVFNDDLYSDSFLGPIMILTSYYILALTSGYLINKKVTSSCESERLLEPSERSPFMKRSSEKELKETDIIELQNFGEDDEEPTTTIFDHIWYGVLSTCEFTYENSYVFTNILMMVWSIVYHSWLTFVLLIWANILWLFPNQRKTMLRSSPFVVFYAELLLIAQYIYGMRLNDDELPTKVEVKGINLKQIGLSRVEYMPCVPILVKTSFTLMFWFTLRQRCKEKAEKKKTSTLAHMAAPLQLTVGAATTDLASAPDVKKTSKFFEDIGSFIKKLLIKVWIWLLLGIVFMSGITGTTMTGFRICYMALFLFFIVAFQCSWKGWLKIMYGFWVFLIFYAMSILILIYTYQFDRFDEYWKLHLNISEPLQRDIGLKQFATKELFLHLVTPTVIVIMTIIQIHYFHKRFVENFQMDTIKITRSISPDVDVEALNTAGPSEGTQPLDEQQPTISNEDAEVKGKFKWAKVLWQKKLKKFFTKFLDFVKSFKEFFWSLLEIHMIKVVILTATIICALETSMLHVLFVFLCVVAFISRTWVQIYISRIISILVSILILANMVYQVDYINHSNYNVTCGEEESPMHDNSADWFGLHKIPPSRNLLYLLRGYIVFMVMTTMHAVVIFRQEQKRAKRGLPVEPPAVIFPKVTKNDANSNLLGLVKYLFNYGFFRFGFEITMIALVSAIIYRKDLMAIVYAFWLCLLMSLERERSEKVWMLFKWFVALVIPLQFILYVGFPPALCIVYPWEGLISAEKTSVWEMLPSPTILDEARKLIFDFVLLLFICRQSRAYLVERKFEKINTEFPGGSNRTVVTDIENLGIVSIENPVHDYKSHTRNWLDVVNIMVFTGFFWLTLAICFLAGTNVLSIFSIGYLAGSFIFLWQGTDFYLRPIRKILLWWKLFLGYNVAVIAIRAILQVFACLFLQSLEEKHCWLVQLFGVSCTEHMESNSDPTEKWCPNTTKVPGLIWDATCFAFLIFQLRIFGSYYFCHIINDAKAISVLASRGAVLIEDFRRKQIQHRTRHEKEVLRKLKAKMEKIRATQQKMLHPVDKPTHFGDVTVPVHCSSSISSYPGSGYHTPIEDDRDNQRELQAEVPSDLGEILSVTPLTGSSLQNQVTSPSSAIMTVSLDDYLEPQRFSFGSPTNSDVQVQNYDDTVFSNEPRDMNKHDDNLEYCSIGKVELNSIGTQTSASVLVPRHHRRQSSVNTVSWNEPVELEDSSKHKFLKTTSEADGQFSILRKRRHLSAGGASFVQEESTDDIQKRRYSNLSWANDESMSVKTTSLRANSWGPIGNMYYLESLMSEISSPSLHRESTRAGDYYMFDDPDEEVELSLMDEGGDFLEDKGKISASEKKISKRKGLLEVYQEIAKRKHEKNAQEAASAPTSVIGLPEDKIKEQRDTLSDPLPKSSPYDLEIDKASSSSDKPDASEPSSKPKKGKGEPGFFHSLVEGMLVSLAIRLHRLSRNFRYVMRILSDEKIQLKETMNGKHGRSALRKDAKPWEGRSGEEPTNTVAEPNLNKDNLDNQSLSSSDDTDTDTKTITIDDDTKDNTNRNPMETSVALSKSSPDGFEEDPFTTRDHHIATEVLISLWYLILSNTDLICYLFVFIHQIVSASLLSLPLPLMVLMWGSLAIPRPSKSFWVTLIAYTQTIVLIKCLFQFKSFWFENITLPNQPLSADKIIGIQAEQNYAAYDLMLLLVMFFHRFILKSQGLWNALELEPTVQSGTYILKDELPDDDDTGSLEEIKKYVKKTVKNVMAKKFLERWKSLASKISEQKGLENQNKLMKAKVFILFRKGQQTAIVTKGRDTLVITKKRIGDATEENEIDLQVSNSIEEPGNYVPEVIKITYAKYLSPITDFFSNLVNKARLPTDVYALMFLCDFINFLVLLFGCTAFGPQHARDGGVQDILAENKVPIPFLIMLLIQFFLIIIDRALYLRKALKLKIGFHLLSVIGIHAWMFFVLPAITERNFNALAPPVIYYLIKCFYFLLSSYQITSGYPKRILGNFLTRGYTYINQTAFTIYKLIPFLYELRTLLDWLCTETTMSLWEWLKMEDIFSEIYFIKCGREYEKSFPTPRAQKKGTLSKIISGAPWIAVFFIIIWAPLLLFAIFNSVGEPNTPEYVDITMEIGPYSPIYRMSARDVIHVFDEKTMSGLQSRYMKNKTALTFITGYYPTDIAAIFLPPHSTVVWGISPPEKESLLDDLLQNRALTMRFIYSITRKSNKKDKSEETVSLTTSYDLNEQFQGRDSLIAMLQGEPVDSVILVPAVFPKFLEIKNSGNLNPVGSILMDDEGDYISLLLKLSMSGSGDNIVFWWTVTENCNDSLHARLLSDLPVSECGSKMVIYTFNDKKFPSTFNWINAGGIIGMYTGLVLLVSRFIRSMFFSSARGIMFSELPYVDRVLQICLDVYLVREAKEFALEEDLFAKLIFLYRSPETMIKWTRPKAEVSQNEEEEEEESRRAPE